MTSFFQPDSFDPTIQECGPSRFDVYCNSIVPVERLLRSPYQVLNLSVGSVAIAVPVLLWLVLALRRSRVWKDVIASSSKKQAQDSNKSVSATTPLTLGESLSSPKDSDESDSSSRRPQSPYHVSILPLDFSPPEAIQDEVDFRKSSRLTLGAASPPKKGLGCVDLASLGSRALEDDRLTETAQLLAGACVDKNLSGLAFRLSSSLQSKKVEKLMQRLSSNDFPALVFLHHDSTTLDSLSLEHAAGVVIQNAVILPNGQRRDYFQAQGLRSIMARSVKERERKPEFFIGFLELWELQPHPAVIRRAVKLAEHFGAAVQHAPSSPSLGPERRLVGADRTLSAFEYLKRPDLTKLQQYWTKEQRKIWIPNGKQAPEMRSLNVELLGTVVPSVPNLLLPEALPPSLSKLQSELPALYEPPDYASKVPLREDFWHSSRDGNIMAPLGCYSICSEPSPEDYASVVQTQQHLKQLDLLHYMKGVASFRLLEALRTLASREQCGHLVQDLIDGLESQQICVYKGLDTGFRIPDGEACFWGVSRARDDRTRLSVDIFISQKAPNNATTILHTWLAHNGVPRDVRYDLEVLLEAASGIDDAANGLPLSIRTGIEQATNAETLQLLQQMQATRLEGHLKGSMVKFCRLKLINRTTTKSRTRTYGRGLLDGSMTMREALEIRLETLAQLGAARLPLLEKLLELHDLVDGTVRDALFFGDKDRLNALAASLAQAFDMPSSDPDSYVDVNTDLFALIFFSVLRKAAFEDVYIEATDRCPLFLQPDQAAVFSELWVLGSQCEAYFGILPRDLGEIIYDRYRLFLEERAPSAADRTGNEIMTMYSSSESSPQAVAAKSSKWRATLGGQTTMFEKLEQWKTRFAEFGAMSIFCLPAIIDVVLLTFLGRGMFMTAFMHPDHLRAAVYALLISLLLSAGVVGWVGSSGNYYLAHYAYDNMIYFHVQRLSGGFVLVLVVAAAGLIGFSVASSVAVGFVFVAFLIAITTYLNLLGILATMHQQNSPMTSGRTVVWRNIPLLLLSPAISCFVNGHDLEIYLPTIYCFLLLLTYQYRQLCHEWSGWMRNIPDFSDKDVLEWYVAKCQPDADSTEGSQVSGKDAQEAFREAVSSYRRRTRGAASSGVLRDAFVGRVSKSMPYVDWLFKKAAPDGNVPPAFSNGWFTQLGDAKKQQQQLARGLKEHNIFMLFRMARYDIGQNLGLFLVALMDRWVSVVMSAREPHASIYTDSRARYGICFCILYFSFSVMILDLVLQKYWSLRFTSSKEPLVDFNHARMVAMDWERMRRRTLTGALIELFRKIIIVFGATTIFLWLFVESNETMTLYYMYVLGYTCVIIFQFNRCFTTNVSAHVTIIFVSAICGFVLGCVLHAVPATAGWLYSDIIAQNCAAVLAAIGTLAWSWSDFSTPRDTKLAHQSSAKSTRARRLWAQRKIMAEGDAETRIPLVKFRKMDGIVYSHEDGSIVSQTIVQLLRKSLSLRNNTARNSSWSTDLMDTVMRMWSARRARIVAVDCDAFSAAGLDGICSVSQMGDGGILTIKIGLFGETELRLPSWQSLLGTVSAECLLYHVARVEFNRSHAQAVQAEHFLNRTTDMSKRIELELATGGSQDLKRVISKTTAELMRHLCWNVDVQADWQTVPQCGREAIFCRIAGQPVSFTEELSRWISRERIDLHAVDFHLNLCLCIFHDCNERLLSTVVFPGGDQAEVFKHAAQLKPARVYNLRAPTNLLQRFFRAFTAVPLSVVKWIAIISGGGSNIERELWYGLRNVFCGHMILRATLAVWRLCRALKELLMHALLIYHRHSLVNITRLAQKGERRKIKRNAIVVDWARKPITAFASSGLDERTHMTVEAFDGPQQSPPPDKSFAFKANYDEHFRLVSREDRNDKTTSIYNYSSRGHDRWPQSKEVVGEKHWLIGIYDSCGRIKHGIMTLSDSSRLNFCYHYKATPKGNSIILAADFVPVVKSGPVDKLSVYWGPPRRDATNSYDWVPSDKVYRIVRIINGRRFVTELEYNHRRDPVSTTIVEEENELKTAVAEVPKLPFEEDSLFKKPVNLSFAYDDILIHHNILQLRRLRQYAVNTLSIVSRWSPLHLWKRKVYLSVPTWRIRTELWNSWLNDSLDAATVCWMDELILREEPLLRKYWRARESGRLEDARRALDGDINQIVSAIELETDISELCLLPIRTSDLYAMGLGRDATEVTNRPQDCYKDTEDRLSVIVNDIGCWPEAPGGVSNCRRDLVNGHSTIRNHVLAECAHDFGIPRFQVEKSVQSLKLLPLWGLDGKTAYHGLMENILQSQVDEKIRDTDLQRDIIGVFIPLLKDFVRGARTKSYSHADLVRYTNVFLSMSKYYEHKDYNQTWSSKAVEDAWAEAWLVPYKDANITDPAEHFDMQRPSMADFKDALGIYLAYFFIFSVRIPEECPRVFQSTHHGISSLFGMLLKYRRGVTFGIWDHAILWRESCLNISPAQCELSVPVQSMLLAGIRLASRLAYLHADIVVPCTSLFNPMWETEIGTDKGKICSKNEFRRKIDPIVNGISNMESFTPVDKVRTDKPTVVMLSNVQFIKGIKPAILAADIIVNRYGFRDYRLLIYGAKDRQPSYALEMAKLIVKCNLSENVVLAGFGKPKEVLQDAWLFVNSSISEGLPLAIGEAALAGVPIVATEVGATALVVTDPDDQGQRYGEVVAPNDPIALARAQLSLLCMVGPWARFTQDGEKGEVGGLPEEMRPEDVEWLCRRMYEKSEDRRRLGLLSREVVLHSFHGRRYLREHEQMYWIQWHMAKMRADQTADTGSRNAFKFGSRPPLKYTESDSFGEDEAAKVAEEEEGEEGKEGEERRPGRADGAEAEERMTLVSSPTGSVDSEAQTARKSNSRSGLSRLLRGPSGIGLGRHHHHSRHVPYSPGGSTAASSFSNWAPG